MRPHSIFTSHCNYRQSAKILYFCKEDVISTNPRAGWERGQATSLHHPDRLTKLHVAWPKQDTKPPATVAVNVGKIRTLNWENRWHRRGSAQSWRRGQEVLLHSQVSPDFWELTLAWLHWKISQSFGFLINNWISHTHRESVFVSGLLSVQRLHKIPG